MSYSGNSFVEAALCHCNIVNAWVKDIFPSFAQISHKVQKIQPAPAPPGEEGYGIFFNYIHFKITKLLID